MQPKGFIIQLEGCMIHSGYIMQPEGKIIFDRFDLCDYSKKMKVLNISKWVEILVEYYKNPCLSNYSNNESNKVVN